MLQTLRQFGTPRATLVQLHHLLQLNARRLAFASRGSQSCGPLAWFLPVCSADSSLTPRDGSESDRLIRVGGAGGVLGASGCSPPSNQAPWLELKRQRGGVEELCAPRKCSLGRRLLRQQQAASWAPFYPRDLLWPAAGALLPCPIHTVGVRGRKQHWCFDQKSVCSSRIGGFCGCG